MNNENLITSAGCDITGSTPNKSGVLDSNATTGEKVSGIYKIINKVNGKYYVGSSNDINGKYGRWYEHITNLNANRHDNQHLQRAWNKYGASAFNFIILDQISPNLRLIKEQAYLDIAKTEKSNTYNMSFIASGGGFEGHHHTKESKQKTSLKLKGRTSHRKGKKSPETSLDKNPRWISVNDNIKNQVIYLYQTFGYRLAKQKTKETFNLGSTVFYRLTKDFQNKIS